MSEKKEKYKFQKQSFPPQIPETKFDAPTVNELSDAANKQLYDFSALLDTLSSVEEKKKALWKNIYENAVTDRKNAYILFADLYKDVHNEPAQHAIHGAILAKYLERMEKSNQQIIKLAEMIDEVAEAEEDWMTDEDRLYEQINNKRNK